MVTSTSCTSISNEGMNERIIMRVKRHCFKKGTAFDWLVQFSHTVVSDSLQPHESQHARPPCPSPTPGVHSDSCPSSWCCHLILCCPLFFLSPIPPSIRVFSNESALHMRWPRYWSFSFSISPSKAHSGLISFRMDWLDLLAVQGTLKSLFQHHSSKASIIQHSAFFTVQLSHLFEVKSESRRHGLENKRKASKVRE